MCGAYRREMLPPISTRALQTSIERQRRRDSELRWRAAFRPTGVSTDAVRQRVVEVSASSSGPGTSSGMTDSV